MLPRNRVVVTRCSNLSWYTVMKDLSNSSDIVPILLKMLWQGDYIGNCVAKVIAVGEYSPV